MWLLEERHCKNGNAKALAETYIDWSADDIEKGRHNHVGIRRFFALYESLRTRAMQGSPRSAENPGKDIWPEFTTGRHHDDPASSQLGEDPFATHVQPIVNLVRNLVRGFVDRCERARNNDFWQPGQDHWVNWRADLQSKRKEEKRRAHAQASSGPRQSYIEVSQFSFTTYLEGAQASSQEGQAPSQV